MAEEVHSKRLTTRSPRPTHHNNPESSSQWLRTSPDCASITALLTTASGFRTSISDTSRPPLEAEPTDNTQCSILEAKTARNALAPP